MAIAHSLTHSFTHSLPGVSQTQHKKFAKQTKAQTNVVVYCCVNPVHDRSTGPVYADYRLITKRPDSTNQMGYVLEELQEFSQL